MPEQPAIVFEMPAPCSDAVKAQELLQRTLAPALAPRSSWTVIARFSRKGPSLMVEGEITDEADAPVAHRILTETSQDCSSLARAVGVWASLVLDSEVERAARTASPSVPQPAVPSGPAASGEKPSPEPPGATDEARTIELGLTMSLMGGMGSGVMAGPVVYGVIETSRGWFLRPALFIERTLEELTSTSDVYGTLVATRFDVCGRISGFHIKRIQLDLCGGAELGFMHFDEPSVPPGAVVSSNRTLPFLGLGPSAALRGELGNGLALVLGGVAELNVVQEGFTESIYHTPVTVNPSLFLGRAELGLSWQVR